MSDGAKAAYYFLPWVRYGALRGIGGKPLGKGSLPTPDVPSRSSFATELQLSGQPAASPADASRVDVSMAMQIHGPGDVIGIDPREIVRTFPVQQTPDCPPHLFPFIEFDRPDFPWLFTPSKPDSEGNLLPWIVLVVVPIPSSKLTTDPNRPLPALTCNVKELPDLKESWAWAHAQYVGKAGLKFEDLPQSLAESPAQNVSRLLCPRKLEPNKGGQNGYLACLVPAFENGRKAGLGEEPGNSLAHAWDVGGESDVTLPVYYQWEFGTGIEEDFEEMVDRLTFLETLPQTSDGVSTSSMTMDVSDSGIPSDGKDDKTLPVFTALAWPDTDTKTTASASPTFLKGLENVLKDDDPSNRPTVLPPRYGQWHAKAERGQPDSTDPDVLDIGKRPAWFRTLNLDPRYRVAAALGTQVIQDQQEQLVAAAWEQAAKAKEANQWIRQKQLALAVNHSIFTKRVQKLSPDRFFQVLDLMASSPAQAPVTEAPTSHASALPRIAHSVLSASFQRMTRPQGALARRLDRSGPEGRRISGNRRLLNLVNPSDLRMGASPPSDPGPNVINWTRLRKNALEELEPKKVFFREVRDRVSRSGSDDPLAPFMFAPTFPQPMYEPLRDLFRNMLLPGIDRIPNNTVVGLDSNSRFIEAYMVGLNHEMSRELLWREFPTSLGHTYFQQFWDVRGAKNPTPDIRPIDAWWKDAPDNSNKPPKEDLGENIDPARGNLKMLLIRGDLLLRYPNTIIYAQKAKWGEDKNTGKVVQVPEAGETNIVYPELRMYLVPGITMLGFNLDPSPEVNDPAPPKNPGWFFVFEEPPTDTRFGLDISRGKADLTTWRELSWKDVTVPNGYLSLNKTPAPILKNPSAADKKAEWGKNSAHMAYITLQKPYRRLMHSSVWWGYTNKIN